MAQKPGSIVHVEFHSRNPTKTKQFYEKVFGWKFTAIPEMNYTLFEAPSPPHGGLSEPMEGMPPGVLNYISSDAIEKTAQRIEQAGGTILMGKTEIPGQGWFAVFQDPEGTVQALYQGMPTPARTGARRTPKKTAKKTKARSRRK